MRNALRYYYNIYCQDIIKINSNYKLLIDDSLYYLVKFEKNITTLCDIYDYLIKNNVYCHEIIINKDNNFITDIDHDLYILIKVYSKINKINYMDIANYNLVIGREKCRWVDLWINKIDYYEYQMDQFKKKYPYLYQTFNYYSGITETAIMLATTVKNNVFDIYIEHDRIYKNTTTLDFYNPLNMIKDVKIRDIAEYFKQQFFYVKNPIISVKDYLDYIKLSNDEAILFMSRLLYPSYYFDLYDEIIQNKIDEKKIKPIVNKVNDYEFFLEEIYSYLKIKYNIPEIEWLIKQ